MKKKYVLYLYSAAAFRQVVLPALNNADYVVRLSAGQFHFSAEVCLCLEVLENIWYLNWEKERRPLCGNEFLKLRLPDGAILSLITRIETSVFFVNGKYALPGNRSVTIGSAVANVICYDLYQLISAVHAVVYPQGESYWIADKSKNGVYINGKRLEGQKELSFGDCLDLFGLRIVFLKEALALSPYVGAMPVKINLRPYRKGTFPILAETPAAVVFFHRSPRKWRAFNTDGVTEIEIEGPAAKRESERQSLLLTLGPSLTFVLPMIISVVISGRGKDTNGGYLYIGLFMGVATAVLSLFWGIINWFFQKKGRTWAEERRRRVYQNYLREVEKYIAEKYQNEREILLERYPVGLSAERWERMAERLWNRNSGQEDFLYQRVGVGELPFSLSIKVPRLTLTMFRDELREEPGRMKEAYGRLKGVPVGIDLKQHNLIGIAGGLGRQQAVRMAAGLMLQIAVNNCYTDVKMAFFYHEEDEEMNRLAHMVKWLPHIWAENRRIRYLAGNRTEAGEVFQALGEICRNQMQKHYVLFVADPNILEGEGFSRYIFAEGEKWRLTTVFLTEGIEDMPNGCNFFLLNDGYFSGILDSGREQELTFDSITMADAGELSRKLAGIRVKENEAGGELPESVPLLSLFDQTRPEDLDIAGKWRKSRIQDSIRVPIGRKAGERLLYLDIHEKYHGPHGLVAGTTGSGKSETLQAYLLSLAIHFSPEDVAFFIIDYKGGGMGNHLSKLPHTVGIVSNLSGNQISRALISIKSENTKRQRLFLHHGMNHINQYTAARKSEKVAVGMPHLFIIVDEFAELKREEPEFMKELVSVAQVGRSLGVHLILATQKPAGVVDDHIFSNTKFRLCLRVQDRQDSMDMLHRPDAATLTGAGRGYLQVGNDEVFEPFQAAYGGAIYEENRTAEQDSRMISRTGKSLHMTQSRKASGMTQAEKIIDYLKKLGEEMGYDTRNKMWLPLLPEKLALAEVEPLTEHQRRDGEAPSLIAVAGLCDHPGEQSQYPLSVDLCRQGNILICGGPATGKSTLLQTLLYSLMIKYSPMEVIFYLIDCSSLMLRPLREMPHVAGFSGEEPDKWERIFYRLKQELKQRKEWFSGGSFMHMRKGSGLVVERKGMNKDLTVNQEEATKNLAPEQKGVGQGLKSDRIRESPPAIVLAIDNYSGFRIQDKEKHEEAIRHLAAEGQNNGIYLIFTTAGINMGEIPGKLAGNFGYRMCLELGDVYQYGEVLRGSRPTVLPEKGKRGRGIVRAEEKVLEFQAALAYGEENDFVRMEKIEQQAREKRKEFSAHAVERIPEIAEVPDFASFYQLAADKGMIGRADRIPLGYEQESGNIYALWLKKFYCFSIIGRKGSGKTNLLEIISCMVAQNVIMEGKAIGLSPVKSDDIGAENETEESEVVRGETVENSGKKIIWIDFSGKSKDASPMISSVAVAGEVRTIVCHIGDEAQLHHWLEELSPILQQRNRWLRGSVAEEIALEDTGSEDFSPIFILIDDLNDFCRHIYHPRAGVETMGGFIEHIWQKGANHGIYWFAAWNPEAEVELSAFPAYQIFTGYGQGLHLGGSPAQQRTFSFDDLSYGEQNKVLKPGIALVPPDEQKGTGKVILPFIPVSDEH